MANVPPDAAALTGPRIAAQSAAGMLLIGLGWGLMMSGRRNAHRIAGLPVFCAGFGLLVELGSASGG